MILSFHVSLSYCPNKILVADDLLLPLFHAYVLFLIIHNDSRKCAHIITFNVVT